jgi:Nucleotidyltransferase of unknown function (DUF6036)
MGREPIMVDILSEIEGIDFDLAWNNRLSAVVDPQSGRRAIFISREDLITAKLAAGRPQDLADVAAIRTAAESHLPQPEEKAALQSSERRAALHERAT